MGLPADRNPPSTAMQTTVLETTRIPQQRQVSSLLTTTPLLYFHVGSGVVSSRCPRAARLPAAPRRRLVTDNPPPPKSPSRTSNGGWRQTPEVTPKPATRNAETDENPTRNRGRTENIFVSKCLKTGAILAGLKIVVAFYQAMRFN